MSQHYNSPRRLTRVCLLNWYLTVLAAFLLILVTPGAFAQGTHVSNPYVGATVYASPDYITEVQAAATANPSWASQIATVGNTPTFVWMGHIGAIYGGAASNNRLNLQGHINAAISNWTLTWTFANGQTITQCWNGKDTQSGANVTASNLSYNARIPVGGSYTGMGFNGSWNNTTNAVPASFAVNGTTCK